VPQRAIGTGRPSAGRLLLGIPRRHDCWWNTGFDPTCDGVSRGETQTYAGSPDDGQEDDRQEDHGVTEMTAETRYR